MKKLEIRSVAMEYVSQQIHLVESLSLVSLVHRTAENVPFLCVEMEYVSLEKAGLLELENTPKIWVLEHVLRIVET